MDLMEELSKYKHYLTLILILVAIYMFISGIQIMFTVGVLVVAFGVFYYTYKKVDTSAMVSVDGQIVTTNIRKTSYKVGSTKKYRYYPEIKYSYDYNGKAYQNDKLSSASVRYNLRSDAQEYLDKYNKLDKLTVYVNPEDPQDSLLTKD